MAARRTASSQVGRFIFGPTRLRGRKARQAHRVKTHPSSIPSSSRATVYLRREPRRPGRQARETDERLDAADIPDIAARACLHRVKPECRGSISLRSEQRPTPKAWGLFMTKAVRITQTNSTDRARVTGQMSNDTADVTTSVGDLAEGGGSILMLLTTLQSVPLLRSETMPSATRKPHPAVPPIRDVKLHQVSATLAFATVELPGVASLALRIEEYGKRLVIQALSIRGQDSKRWAVYELETHIAAAIEAEIALKWAPTLPETACTAPRDGEAA